MCHTESKHLKYACQDSRLTQRQATYLSSPCGRWMPLRVAGERAETMRCRCERDTWPTDGMEPFRRVTTPQCVAWYLRTVEEFLMYNCRIENTDVKMWKHDQFSFRPLQVICIQVYRFSKENWYELIPYRRAIHGARSKNLVQSFGLWMFGGVPEGREDAQRMQQDPLTKGNGNHCECILNEPTREHISLQ